MKTKFTTTVLSILTTIFSMNLHAKQTITGSLSNEAGIVLAKYILTQPNCFNSEDGAIEIYLDESTEVFWPDGSHSNFKKNLKAGDYQLKIEHEESFYEFTLNLESPDQMLVSIHQTTNLNAVDLTAVVTGGVSPYTFEWNNGMTSQSIENITSSGVFEVTIFDDNNCKATSNVFVHKEISSSPDFSAEKFKIELDYSNNILTVKGEEIKKVIVQHETGLIIADKGEPESGLFSFYLPKKGIYVITILENNETIQKKIII